MLLSVSLVFGLFGRIFEKPWCSASTGKGRLYFKVFIKSLPSFVNPSQLHSPVRWVGFPGQGILAGQYCTTLPYWVGFQRQGCALMALGKR
jgi:hypothetical protein